MIFIFSHSAWHSNQVAKANGLHKTLDKFRHVGDPYQMRGFRGPEHSLWVCSCVAERAQEMMETAKAQDFSVTFLK